MNNLIKQTKLMDKGVTILNPESVLIGEDVDLDRISGTNVTLYPGVRLFGEKTLICNGVTIGKAIGSPKMDPIFGRKFTSDKLDGLHEKLQLDRSKKTIIFTSTYDSSGLSAIQHWIDNLESLSKKYR